MRLDQYCIYTKIYPKGKVSTGCSGKVSCGRFRRQGDINWRVRWLILKGGRIITGDELRVGLTLPPQFDTGGIEVSPISGESLLEAKEEGRRRKE